ncbi:MAG: WG repeat-containing protein [Oscillospiraceae bacterium]|nr:WG repeat-containing protein [Oscillospiraceae bacterium]MBQ6845551.1 WG repeat-containing protein [Oscillospiraceae bacterium]
MRNVWCSQCGQQIQAQNNETSVVCPYCNTTVNLPASAPVQNDTPPISYAENNSATDNSGYYEAPKAQSSTKKIAIILSIVAVLAVAAVFIFGKKEVPVPFYDEETEKWGYCSMDGEIIVDPEYDRVGTFPENGLAVVAIEEEPDDEYDYYSYKYGFIDEDGEEVVKPKYDRTRGFAENGLAAVAISEETDDGYDEEKWGFIDKDGEEVIKLKYADTYGFAENGLAAVAIKEETDDGYDYKWGFIDEDGEMVIDAEYDDVSNFDKNGIAGVEIEEKDSSGETIYKTYYIDEEGNIIEPK